MSSSSSSYEGESWITWFCSQMQNKFFCEVEEEFIIDKFNLTGLITQVPLFREAMDVILDMESGVRIDDNHSNLIDQSAERLYGLIHARYILTEAGIVDMIRKYEAGDFEHCPRISCDSQPMLPVGLSDLPDTGTVKSYCPRCMDIYTPKSPLFHHTDGAFFGTGFPHMVFMTHPECRPKPPTSLTKYFGKGLPKKNQPKQGGASTSKTSGTA